MTQAANGEWVPDIEPDPSTGTAVAERTVGWHRHRWTEWGKPFGSGGLASLVNGSAPPWWQERHCTQCGRVQRARVDLPHGARP